MKKIVTIAVLVCLIFVSGCSKKDKEKTEKATIKIVENGVYEKPKKAYNVQIKEFNKLEKVVGSDSEELARLVAINFSFDFFTLKNKSGAADVGGLTYLPESRREEFQVFSSNYVYREYQNIVNDYGKSELPKVVKAKVTSVESITAMYTIKIPGDKNLGTIDSEEEQEFPAYQVSVNISYEDSDLDKMDVKTSAVFIIIDIEGNGRLEIIEMQ
ncbi:MAG: hypothetical protein ACK5KR_06305 [Breznakia sp.]